MEENYLSVLIVNQSLEHRGLLSNAAFVLGLTAGRELPPSTFGENVWDKDGKSHKYLTKIAHHVRKASGGKIRAIREAITDNSAISAVDYPEEAAPSDYSIYSNALKEKAISEIDYRAIHLYGPESLLLPLTKNLSRLGE
ncbi:MAG: DUF2000 family protein [Proteobacteria bacterium]|nr:DUF2000 family protein [Pseudomonadota bacterium]